MLYKKLFVLNLMLMVSFSVTAYASDSSDASAGFTDLFNAFFGDTTQSSAQSSCTSSTTDTSLLGSVNQILCHMERDMGIKATGNATKSYTDSTTSTAVTVHCEISANASSATYSDTASCWICSGASSACTSASSFSRFMNLQWSYLSNKTVNKGELLMDFGAFSGTLGKSGMNMTYDVGTSSSSKTITAKLVEVSSSETVGMRVDASESSTLEEATLVTAVTGNSSPEYLRFDTVINTSSDATLVNLQTSAITDTSVCTSGISAASMTAASDTPTCSACFVRAATSSDFDYTTSTSACSSMSLIAYPSDSLTNVSNYDVTSTDTSSNNIMGTNGNWNSMSANPSSI